MEGLARHAGGLIFWVLCLQGEDFLSALSRVEFVVVQDILLRKSTRRAHVVLPATSFLEQEGTFTNTERRVRQLRPVKAGPDGTLPDWRILADLIARLHTGANYGDASRSTVKS
jgi:predicted molibdopterin-dependent oxidoreductase YjgC